jgi:hypothetical protein
VLITLASLIYAEAQRESHIKVQLQAEKVHEQFEEQRYLADKNAKEATLQAERAQLEATNARRAEAEAKIAKAQAEQNQRIAEAARARAERTEAECGKKK